MKSLNDFDTVRKYLARINAEPRSLLKAVVKEQIGNYWIDLAIIKFSKLGDVEATEGYEPTSQELEAIKAELSTVTWPQCITIPEGYPGAPALVRDADPEDIYEFRDVNGNITMLQVRKVRKGEKSYIPVTYYDDDEYRFAEPEGLLPLYGLENLKNNTTVFISEGAKAARYGQLIADGKVPNHPWATELSYACHVGFVGGALSPARTDWSVLKKYGVKRAYIIADNDLPGNEAVPKIAQHLSCPTFAIQFTNEFPVSFDIADPFPENFFRKIGSKRFYTGPGFRDCLNPATYMTNLIKIVDNNGKDKIVPVLRYHARDQWAYIETNEMWVNTEFPDIMRRTENLDKMLVPFSDAPKTSNLLFAAYTGRTPNLCYRPDIKGKVITNAGTAALNLYVPPSIKGQEGDISPFLEFMEYLIPDEKDRHETLRWVATLIGRPDVRMLYGLLLISSVQGIGKSTLAEKICAPLVGMHNCSFPSESQITDSNFNGWLAQKRLAVVAEIYAGSSWKAANKLKSYITDTHIDVNPKFERPYKIENWVHIAASSNSHGALKIEQSDRRWLIPTVNEEKWPRKTFDSFFDWLDSGGLSIIKWWSENVWKDYVQRGESAPMSQGKADMIDDSRSEAQNEAMALAKMMNSLQEPVGIGFRDIKQWLKQNVQSKFFDTDHDIRKALKDAGVGLSKKRVSLDGREQAIAFNKPLMDKLREIKDEKEKVVTAKTYRKKPEELMGEAM